LVEKRFVTPGAIKETLFVDGRLFVSLETVRTVTPSRAIATADMNSIFIPAPFESERAISFKDV
jgi:hypothetical protein